MIFQIISFFYFAKYSFACLIISFRLSLIGSTDINILSNLTIGKTTRLKHLPSYLKILFNFRMTGFKSSLNNNGKEYVVTNAKCADSSKG